MGNSEERVRKEAREVEIFYGNNNNNNHKEILWCKKIDGKSKIKDSEF